MLRLLLMTFSTSVSKGFQFLVTPLIYFRFNNAEVVGEYALIAAISALLAPFVAINATPVLLRASEDPRLMQFISSLVLSICLPIAGLSFLMVVSGFEILTEVISLVVVLSSADALFLVASAYYRSLDSYWMFFFITLVRAVATAFFIGFSMQSLESLIVFSSVLSCALALIVSLNIVKSAGEDTIFSATGRFRYLNLAKESLHFGVKLLPHSIGSVGNEL